MTAILTQTVIETVISASYETVSTTFGAIIILLLLALLMLRELVRGGGGRQRWATRAFDLAAVPLLAATALVIVLRLLSLIRL